MRRSHSSFTFPPSPLPLPFTLAPFRLTLTLPSLTLEIIVDTPTETPHGLTSDPEPNAPSLETTPGLYGAQTSAADAAVAPEPHAGGPAWGLAAAFGVWFASVGLMLVSGVLAFIIYLVIRPTAMNAEDLQRAAQSDPLLILLSVAAMVPAHLLTFATAWAVATGFGKRTFREAVGWSWGERFGFWASVGVAVALCISGILLTKLYGGQETDIDKIIASSNAARLSVAFLAVATAPIVEETVYRGLLFPPVARAAGMKWAVVIVSVMFAAVHLMQYRNNPAVIAAVTVLSFTLTWVRAHTGRLLPCFVIHAVFNGIQAVLIVAQPYLKTPAPTQPVAPQGMLLDAVTHALLALIRI